MHIKNSDAPGYTRTVRKDWKVFGHGSKQSFGANTLRGPVTASLRGSWKALGSGLPFRISTVCETVWDGYCNFSVPSAIPSL